jgi:hypothetical protein
MQGVLTRWRRQLLGLGSVLLLIALAICFWPKRSPRFSQEQCDAIELGMTRTQVEVVLGAPPGDYATGPVFHPYNVLWELGVAETEGEWKSDTGRVNVGFDREGLVVWKQFEPGLILRQTWWGRVRGWLRLRTSSTLRPRTSPTNL